MRKKLKPEILRFLSKKLERTPEKIRPRLSEIRRSKSGLTMNAAAQVYALQQGTSIMAKLDDEDRHSLASTQSISQVSSSKTVKIDKRTLNITNSPIHNLSFGDRTNISQAVYQLDNSLVELLKAVESSKEIPPEEKEDYKSDIQTLASQIGKKIPNKSIIKAAWKGLGGLATIEGCLEFYHRVEPLIKSFLN